MSVSALALGAGIGLLHWLMFFLSTNKLFAHKENTKTWGIAGLVAFLRLLVTAGLGALVIVKLGFPAWEVAVGVLVGFNVGRIPFLARSKRAAKRLSAADNSASST